MAEPKRLGDFGARLTAKLREVRETHEALGEVAEADETHETELGMAVRHLRECGFPEKSVRWIEANGLEPLRASTCGKRLVDFMGGELLVAVLEGATGSWKTTTAALAFLAAKRKVPDGFDAEAGRTVYREEYDAGACMFFDAEDLRRLHPEHSNYHATLDGLESVPVLVLDDLGCAEADSGKVVEVFQGLVKKRDARCLKTIITTNGTTEELAARYGPRVASRLRQECVTIGFGDKDKRVPS